MITPTDIHNFVAAVNELRRDYFNKHYPSLARVPENYLVDYDIGRKYVRVHTANGPSRSVYCFVDKETGDILLPACWARPAKGVRGNIANGATELTVNGPKYLK